MNDVFGPGGLPELLDRVTAGITVAVGEDGQAGIEVDQAVAELVDAHPVLLLPEADVELTLRLGSAADEAAQQRIMTVRQVLQICREAGSAAPLRGSTEDRSEGSEPSGREMPDGAQAKLSLLGTLSTLGRQFAEGGVLRASLAAVRGMVLNSLMKTPAADREAIRVAMLSEFDEGLPLLWALQPSTELAGFQEQAGTAYGDRLRGDRTDNQERAIACFESALEVYSKVSAPHDWARTQNNLGLTYINRLSGNPSLNQEQAIACFEASLDVYSHDDSTHDWAWTQNNLGTAYRNRLRGNRAENQEQAIACYNRALTVYSRDAFPYEWAMAQDNLGATFRERLRGDRAKNLERAITSSLLVLEVFSKEGTPHDWAMTQGNLGSAYMKRERGDRAENQDRAIACFKAALEVYSKAANPHDWANAQNSLGAAYNERLRGNRAENQEHAIAHYEAALEVYSRVSTPHDWARTQNNLGNAYLTRPLGDRAENRESAIACYQAALAVRSKNDTPHDWANTQNNLGNAYGDRLRGNRSENQDRALACYQAALEVFSKDGTPHDWARTQHNLGTAYRERLRGDRAENQERAIACFQATLEVYSKDGTPYEWARTQSSLGAAYHERLKEDRGENLEQAIYCYKVAMQVYSEESTPHYWATAQNNLGNTYCNRLRGSRAENLEQAIACFHAALRVRTQAATPHDWAGTQNNLGIVYRNRLRGDRAKNQEQAIACYQAALEVYDKEGTPHSWALTQNNLGVAYSDRLLGDRVKNQERAIACWMAAEPLLRLSNPPFALNALTSVGNARRELGHAGEARTAWQAALCLRETLLGADTSAETRGEAARGSRDLVARLALLEVALGEPTAAVATLERGRAIALRTALALDDVWFSTLPSNLRAPIEQAGRDLARLRQSPPSAAGAVQPGAVRVWEEAIAAAQAQRVAALAAAQEATDFRPPPPLDAAALAALAPVGGAMVLLAAAPEGGVAFLLPHADPGVAPVIEAVLLPGATSPVLGEMLIGWNDAYRTFLQTTSRTGSVDPDALRTANAPLEVLLDGVWQHVMGPVLARLPAVGLGSGAPLVLLPQGDLALMPLHAAGPVIDGHRRCVLDDREIRYAPSGFALQTAAERLTQRQAAGIIDTMGRGQDLSGAFNPMKGTKDELPRSENTEMPALRDLFKKRLGQAARCSVGGPGQPHVRLEGEELPWATVAQVLEYAPLSGYLHLACHGSFDMRDPAGSGLQLAGTEWGKAELLTVLRIVRDLRLGRCRLVTLSACETAMVDMQHLPDEFVGLPAAFLQAGAPGVVATFWSVLDGPTAAMMVEFYKLHLEGEGMEPAAALRRAVLNLRDTGEAAVADLKIAGIRQATFGDAPDDDGSDAPTGPSELPPDLRQLLALPIVWAAYAHHGV